MDKTFIKNLSLSIRASFENAVRLLADSQYLLEYERFPTAFALSILAQEEFAKTFLLLLVKDGALPWDSNVHRALRDHTCKQLVASIMDYLDSESDKWTQTYLATQTFPSKAFPSHIADALNIIHLEKLPRDEKFLWEDGSCDEQARAIADGEIDKQKQNAIYVSLGKTGQLTSSPAKITKSVAALEYEKTTRLKYGFNPYGQDVEISKSIMHTRVFDTFRMFYGSMSREEYDRLWKDYPSS